MRNFRFLLLSLSLLAFVRLSAGPAHEIVEMPAPGKLSEIINSRGYEPLDSLTVSGKINGADLAYIVGKKGRVAAIRYVDIASVQLVPGEDIYVRRVVAPPAGMGTTFYYDYVIADRTYTERQPGRPDLEHYRCYTNDLSAAFHEMDSLREVRLPEGLPGIGAFTFEYCDSLKRVVAPAECRYVGAQAFYYCRQFSFDLPAAVERVGAGAFAGTSLKGKLDLTNVEELGIYAFQGSLLSEVVLGVHVKEIPEGLFSASSNLRSVTIAEGVESIGAEAFKFCGELATVVIPRSLKEVGKDAFLGTRFYRDLPAENGVAYLGNIALAVKSCPDGKLVVRDGTVTLATGFAGSVSGSIRSVVLPESLESIGDEALSLGAIEEINFPSQLAKIGDRAFEGCGNLKEIELPPFLRHLGSGAFARCTSLSVVTLPAGLRYVGGRVFDGCSGVSRLNYLPANASTDDGASPFIGMDGLSQVSIGSAVTRIPDHMFAQVSADVVKLSPQLESIGKSSFYRCKVKNISFPDGIVEIDSAAFLEAEIIVTDWSNTLQKIGEAAFYKSSLDATAFPDALREIGPSAFAYCKSLRVDHWPLHLETVGDNAFLYCTSIREVSLPEGTRVIGEKAFSRCDAMMKVYIPSTVERIGNLAFASYYIVNDIVCAAAAPPSIESICYEDRMPYGWLHVPARSLDLYRNDSKWGKFANITSIETLDPVTSESVVDFSQHLSSSDDLSDAVVNNLFISLYAGDYFDDSEGCIVLNGKMAEESVNVIAGMEPGISDLAHRFDGFVASLAAGRGSITLDCQTVGTRAIAVKTGTADPVVLRTDDRGKVSVDYDVAESTCAYIYATSANVPEAAAGAGADCVKVYAVGVKPTFISGVGEVQADGAVVTHYYTPDGRRVARPSKPGIYIIRKSDNTTGKVLLK